MHEWGSSGGSAPEEGSTPEEESSSVFSVDGNIAASFLLITVDDEDTTEHYIRHLGMLVLHPVRTTGQETSVFGKPPPRRSVGQDPAFGNNPHRRSAGHAPTFGHATTHTAVQEAGAFGKPPPRCSTFTLRRWSMFPLVGPASLGRGALVLLLQSLLPSVAEPPSFVGEGAFFRQQRILLPLLETSSLG